MEFLFDNPIANMQGPLFLVLFFGFTFVSVVILYLLKSSVDWTAKLSTPNVPYEIDPFEIAYLRGGENELTRSVVFSLTKKGFLEITNEGKQSFISQAKIQPNWTELSQIERNVLTYFQVTRETKELFGNSDLTRIVSPFAVVCEAKAKQANFLTPTDVKVKTRFLAVGFAGITASIGFYKLLAALLHGRFNVIFLIAFIIISAVIFFLMSKTKRLSALGENYVAQLQTAFDRLRNLKASAHGINNQPTMNGIDPTLLAVGLFGTSVLVGSGYSNYEKAFQVSSSTVSCGSSCGSSCSSGSDSGSSSCSSSGCSSGCGGGCGGCS
jgi:uncharacterized protein (TIGR04222 family)